MYSFLRTLLTISFALMFVWTMPAIAEPNENWFAAAKRGDIATVRTLLAKGADVNAQNKFGQTALMYASIFDKSELVKTLLAKGADVNVKDKKGMPALWFGLNHFEVVKLLLAKGADVNAKYEDGGTALMLAARGARVGLVKLLLDKGADINAKDDDGKTALMSISGANPNLQILRETGKTAAAGVNYPEVVKMLLAKGADVNAKDKHAQTALIYASLAGRLEIVRQLLDKRADVRAKNEYDQTALMLAASRGHLEVVKVLLANGADVNAKTKDAKTALDFANSKKHAEIVALLKQARWYNSFDFDGDQKKDTVAVSYSGSAHCCYRISIKLSSQSQFTEFPFEVDGGYVGGLDLSRPDNFFISDFDNDGKPEIYMHIQQYNGEDLPIPRKWQRKYGFSSNKILIDFRKGSFMIYDFVDNFIE